MGHRATRARAPRRRRFPAKTAVWTTLIAGLLIAGSLATALDPAGPQSEAATPTVAPTPPPPPSSPTARPDDATASEPAASASPTRTASPQAGTALATLGTLEVRGRAPRTGYDRDEFGQRWRDVDRNGCDTRNDILARDLTDVVREGRCRVRSGVLDDPFTGETIAFRRGQGTSELVQIDHVVALSDAWQKGAQQLTAVQREAFANDPLNLLAVDGPANAQKGDGDAATWLPSNRTFRCEYVARQVSVKAAYELWVTSAERDAMARVLEGCPTAPALTSVRADAAAAPGHPPAAPGPDGSAGYANCTEVRAAGAAPILSTDPGYSSRFDGDGDGVGCE
ncbi:DUF1524 domain-containing protein [Microbacterium sp. 179-B 1A2 NHS]|uniref:GmrSD restriction endonuclease domain-containing protein n=1 Tax=Microbacterium sp. 179-B 1A2 NHS TaxID=3142383 RepID=UPI0039A1BC50